MVRVVLPQALIDFVDGHRAVDVEVPEASVLGDVVTALTALHPALGRRIVDETGDLRRFASVYVGPEST